MHTHSQTATYTVPTSSTANEREETLSKIWAFHITGEAITVSLAIVIGASITGSDIFEFTSIVLGAIALWIIVQFTSGLYRWENLLKHQSAIQSAANFVPWILILLGIAHFIPNPKSMVPTLFLVAMIGAPAVAIWREFAVRTFSKEAADKARRDVLVLGWSDQVSQLHKHLHEDEASLYQIAAYIPTETTEDALPDIPRDIPRVPSSEYLETILKQGRFDSVLISDLNISDERLLSIHRLCAREMVEFMMAPNFLRTMVSGLHVEAVGGVPLMKRDRLPLKQPLNRALKRAMDISGGIAGLILSAPIIAIFGAIVYRESPGPIFYRQIRVGKNGRPFEIVKIRSMRLNADKEKAGFSTQEDPRRLKIGALMRKLNIDETPQFWNVIKGEMSLVGPRPERPELITEFRDEIENYNLRHSVKPGISGWAQINGWRGDTDLVPRIQHDLEYVERWNLWLDIYIMLKTFRASKNAY